MNAGLLVTSRTACVVAALAVIAVTTRAAQSARLPKVAAAAGHGVIVLASGSVKVFAEGGRPWTASAVPLPGLRNVTAIAFAFEIDA